MIAYLLNQYPQPSQSFIRREILALEQLGEPIERFTLHRWDQNLVDEKDQAEQAKTRAVFDGGYGGLIAATLGTFIRSPLKFLKVLSFATRMGWRSARGVGNHWGYVAEACVLLKWFRRRNIHHVHSHFATNATAAAMFAHMLGGPHFSFTIHGPDDLDKPEFYHVGTKVHHARFCAVISNFTRSQVYRWSERRDWDKLHIIHCGLDEQFLNAPATAPPAAPRLVCVGRLANAKGHFILMKAAVKLAQEAVDFELILIGDGPFRAEIESTIAACGLANKVKLMGWQSNQTVLDTICNSRAMVLPSFAEGLPVVFMESLAMERPVITTTVAGIPELVQHGKSGWIVTPGAVEPLVNAMREALQMPVDRLWEMGKIGHAIVKQNHTAINEAEKLLRLFRENNS